MQVPLSLKSVCLQLNCGFARTAIRELTPLGKRPSNSSIAIGFRQLFGDVPNFGVTDGMFECSHHWKGSKFERNADIVIQYFAEKWRPAEMKEASSTFLECTPDTSKQNDGADYATTEVR